MGLIIHLFNEHVMQGNPHIKVEPWSLEKLADWIESVDPTPREEPLSATVEEALGILVA